jgi:PAS domain S-box-containing protein
LNNRISISEQALAHKPNNKETKLLWRGFGPSSDTEAAIVLGYETQYNKMSIGSQIISMLMGGTAAFADHADSNHDEKPHARQFVPCKDLCETDLILVDMLNSEGHEDVCYCVCDPALEDTPIIFASDGFCTLTGYDAQEIQGRNCRFLQGPATDKDEVDRIRTAIHNKVEASVNLLNYRKDGTTFVNQFFLTPLRGSHQQIHYVRKVP